MGRQSGDGGAERRRAAKLVALAESPDAPACYGRAFKDLFTRQQAGNRAVPAELEIGEPTVQRLPTGGLGDEATDLRIVVPVSGGGDRVDFYFDVVLVRAGRFAVGATYQSAGRPFPPDVSDRLTRTMLDRAPAA